MKTNKERVLQIVTRLQQVAIERHENDKLKINFDTMDKENQLWNEQWQLKMELLKLTKDGEENDSKTL